MYNPQNECLNCITCAKKKNQKRTKSIKNNVEIMKIVVSKKNFYQSLETIICQLIHITTIKWFIIVLVPLVYGIGIYNDLSLK
jgi:hypothetical protein